LDISHSKVNISDIQYKTIEPHTSNGETERCYENAGSITGPWCSLQICLQQIVGWNTGI